MDLLARNIIVKLQELVIPVNISNYDRRVQVNLAERSIPVTITEYERKIAVNLVDVKLGSVSSAPYDEIYHTFLVTKL